MNILSADQIRAVAVIGHGGVGKTSLVDAALFTSGAVTRMGRVDDGSSVSDYDPDEQKHRMSINLSVIPVEWRASKINLLDTPGYADFAGEMVAGLRVADAALLVVSAEKGVEVGAELAWARADSLHLPRAVFVNKLDRENTSFDAALDALRARFGPRIAPLTLPLGEQSALTGVVDLVSGKLYTADAQEAEDGEPPAQLAESMARYREQLIELAVESDDELMAKYLEGEELSDDEVRRAIRQAVAAGALVPALAGSIGKQIGVRPLLDAINAYLPCAALRFAESGVHQDDAPAAFVFKTIVDPQKGQQTFFRVYSGALTSDARLSNLATGADERLAQLYCARGKAQEPVSELRAGDIGMVVKLANTHTGDTLGLKGGAALAAIQFPTPAYTLAVAPKTQSDMDKLGVALSRLVEEDPTLAVTRDGESAETLLSGLGESHLDIALERMQRRFGVEVVKRDRRVPYRETITKKAKAEGRHKKQSGGHGQFADVWLEIEPLPVGAVGERDVVFENKIVGGVVPKEYVPGVEKGVMDSLRHGFLAGYPMTHIRVALVDGKYHPVDSSSQAFEVAAHLGMKEAVALAGPTLLEPILTVTIEVPDAYMGDITSDLNTKRARILGMEQGAEGMQRITAQAPMAEMLHYARDLRSITQGRGSFSVEMGEYEEVPAAIQRQIIEATKKEHE